MQDESQPAVADLEAPPAESFDLMGLDNPSFAVLQAGRASVFKTAQRAESFRRLVHGLGTSGDEGRRRGLGLWVLGEHEAAAEQLAAFEGDDVADFTRARSLASLGRFTEAEPLFARLAKAYPDEPRPLGGLLEVQLEAWLAEAGEDQEEAVADRLEKALDSSPEGFLESAEGHYLCARLCELGRDFECAIDYYAAARELDPTLHPALVRGAYLAERCGLDGLAIELYETAVRTHNADRAVLLNLGVLYEDQGRDPQAAACYDTVVRSYPTDERARLYLEDARSAMEMYYDEDLERKEDKLNQILRIPISDFELSVRARNCLNKMEIHTLGDLVCKSEQELLSYKNFGETSLNEIKEILRSKGLRLGMPREEAVASIEARARRQAPDDSGDIHSRPITDLQLSIRARRAVELLGCLTIGDITKHSADELLGMQNFGTTSLQELRSKLTELGLKLTDE